MRIPDAVRTLQDDLTRIFGSRLQSFVVYGLRARAHDHDHEHHTASPTTHTLAVVDQLSAEDLRACAARLAAWHDRGLATPLLVASHEFARSLDAFPFEFGAILSDHAVVSGSNPFAGLIVDAADLRRACEIQARGHLLHLREGYLETLGNKAALAVLIVSSAPAFAALLVSLAKLNGADADGEAKAAARAVESRLQLPNPTATEIVGLASVTEIPDAEAERLFPSYLDLTERLVAYVDGWK